MGKYTTEQLEQELFALMCETTTQITSNKEIFPDGFTYDDYERVFIYAYSVAFSHNEILNNKLEKGFFSSCLAAFYKMARESYNYSLEETREKMANGIKYFEPFHAAHINYMMHAKDEDALVNYVSAILSNIPSTKDKSAFSISGVAFASILPDILNRIFAVCEKIASLNAENNVMDKTEKKSVNNPEINNSVERKTGKTAPKPLLFFLIIALVCSVIGNVFLYSNSVGAKSKAESEVKHWKQAYDDLYLAADGLKNWAKTVKDEYFFYTNNAVIAPENDRYYHSYTCGDINFDSFYIFNSENAEYQGYSPCPNCDPNNELGFNLILERIVERNINKIPDEYGPDKYIGSE